MHPMNPKHWPGLLLSLVLALVLNACGGGSGSGPGQGSLSTSLTDAAIDGYRAVYVTISRVEVHMSGGDGWQTVANPEQTYNLLELVNGVRETLGLATLEAGHYTQMRLILAGTPDARANIFSQQHPFANYLIDANGLAQELTTPSGRTTGLKLVNGFDIQPGLTTELILDFDAMHSVVRAGASGKYQLKPTVKVLDVADGAIVSGQVRAAGTTPPAVLDGTLVTAQSAAPSSIEVSAQVVASTFGKTTQVIDNVVVAPAVATDIGNLAF